MGECTRETAGATHSLSCGTTDRECNQVKYLQEALVMLESFHLRDTRRGEVTLVERPRWVEREKTGWGDAENEVTVCNYWVFLD